MSKKKVAKNAKAKKAKANKAANSKTASQSAVLQPIPIVADANAYGTYAKISALADYLEVCALKKVTIRKQQLADIIGDNGWQLRELMINPTDQGGLGVDDDEADDPEESLPEALDLAEDAADRVFSTIRERADILGNRYPFKIDGESVVLKPGVKVRESVYVAMLAITVAHTYRLSQSPQPTAVFEDVVGDVLKNKIKLGINFGRVRKSQPFLAALEAACPKLNLKYSLPSILISRKAQDENVDTIGHLHWGDGRPGAWCFIGQATCAKSDEWEKKLDEPKPATWAPLLGILPRPLVFLAVPHHVEEVQMARLVQADRGIVLDRLRLTMNLEETTGDKQKLVTKMLNAKLDAV